MRKRKEGRVRSQGRRGGKGVWACLRLFEMKKEIREEQVDVVVASEGVRCKQGETGLWHQKWPG